MPLTEQEELELLELENENAKYSKPVVQPEGMVSKAWSALNVPSEMSKEGLNKLTDVLTPTIQDIESGKVGKIGIAARSLGESVAEVAPQFIDRQSLLTAGALGGAKFVAPVIGKVGGWIGRGAERLSGLSYHTPGVLAETVKDPTLLFAKGTESASDLYKEASAYKPDEMFRETRKVFDAGSGVYKEEPILTRIRESFRNERSHNNLIDKGLEAIQDGNITSEEALKVRQSVDALKKTMPKGTFKELRQMFDTVAKEKFADADKAFQRAIKAENMRNIMSINKTGTPSLVKLGVSGFKPVLAPFLSPIAQGASAAAIGTAGKAISPFVKNPFLGSALPLILRASRSVYKNFLPPVLNENQ